MKKSFVLFFTFFCITHGFSNESVSTLSSDDYLNPTVREFQPVNLHETTLYRGSESLPPSQCGGSNIVHKAIGECDQTYSPKVYVIPHSAMYHDGERCGTGKSSEYLIIVPGLHVRSATIASEKGLSPLYTIIQNNPRAANAMDVLQDLDPIHVGVEYGGHRVCGGEIKYTQGSVFLFIRTTPGSRDLNFGFAYLAVSELGVITVKPDQQICLYKDTRNLGPGQSPFATPSPSPSFNSTGGVSEEDLFTGLTDPAFMNRCFPATKLVPSTSPPPSQPPTTSAPPTTTPASTVTPGSTATPNVTTTIEPTKTPIPSGQPNGTLTPSATPSPTKTTPIPTETSKPTTNATATASKSPLPSPTAEEDDGSVCFPNNAEVTLSNGNLIPITELQVGNRVLVGNNEYSDVFLFTHHTAYRYSRFINLTVASGKSITLSPGHYIPASGKLKTASAVIVGDQLTLANGRKDHVISSEIVWRSGLHNPQTLGGNIVINGIVASTLTRHIRHTTAMSLLAPVKFSYGLGIWPTFINNVLTNGNDFIASLLPNGPTVLRG